MQVPQLRWATREIFFHKVDDHIMDESKGRILNLGYPYNPRHSSLECLKTAALGQLFRWENCLVA